MFPVKDNIPTRRFPVVTVGLILANTVAYVLASGHGGSLISGPSLHEVYRYGAIPDAFTHAHHHQTSAPIPTWETVFTAMFLHASILHLAGNMLFLWIFGRNVEQALGRVRFLLFYLLAGVVTLALQVAFDPHSTAPTLGASGPIAGVIGAYILLFPRAKVLTVVFLVLFFTVVELPIWIMLAAWFGEQAAFAATHLTDPAGGAGVIAYVAHVGGFAFGLLTIRLLARRTAQPPTGIAV